MTTNGDEYRCSVCNAPVRFGDSHKCLSYSAALQQDDVAPSEQWASKRWYFFRVQPQKEFVARRLLRKLGYDCFCPTEEKVRRLSRHVKGKRHDSTRYPAMRGYVLIGFDGLVPWYQLSLIKCIQGIVAPGGQPLTVDQAAIKRLIRLSETNVPNVISTNLHKAFNVGDRALWRQGTMAEHTITIKEIIGDRVRTEINGMRVTLPSEELDAA